jgi:hypothetical protein
MGIAKNANQVIPGEARNLLSTASKQQILRPAASE